MIHCVILLFPKGEDVGFPCSSSIIAFLNNHDFGVFKTIYLEFVSGGGQAHFSPEACPCLLI